MMHAKKIKERVAWNEMESGYTESNFQAPIHRNEPQGKLEKMKWKADIRRATFNLQPI